MDTPEIKAFIKDVRKKCREIGVKLIFAKGEAVKTPAGFVCAGYFDDNIKTISVAKGNSLWLGVLAHEFAHCLQWQENSIEWQKDQECGNEVMEAWLNGKEVKNLRKAINNIIALELDCEKRALKLIAKYDLPVNTPTYIQRANECILYYRWAQLVRKWDENPGVTIWQHMPQRFMSLSYYRKLSPKMEQIFAESGY